LTVAEIHIHDGNWHRHVAAPVVGGEHKARGLVPRNYATHPRGCYANVRAVDFPLIPPAEFAQRARDKEAAKSRLSDLRLSGAGGVAFPSLDQDGVGYCWAHSSTHAVMYLRLVQNQPVVPLSAFSVAATIKRGADEGGWGAQSLDFITEKGVMAQSVWPQKDRNYRQYDKPENWANAALHKVTEGWVDLNVEEYDRKLTFDQVITLLLSDVPVVVDFNWWSHSVLAVDAVDGAGRRGTARAESGKLMTVEEFEEAWGMNDPVTAGMSVRIQNSWSDTWGQQGTGILSGSKAVPDGAVAPRVSVASDT
jgi:hypothetical protein